VFEPDGFFAAGCELDLECMSVDEFAAALEVLDLSAFGEQTRPARQPFDDGLLERSQFRKIDRRVAEADAPRFRVTRFTQQVRDVQQGLLRNAAAIHADTAGVHLRIDERRLEAQISGEKRSRVAAGPTADDYNLNVAHDRSPRRHEDTKASRR